MKYEIEAALYSSLTRAARSRSSVAQRFPQDPRNTLAAEALRRVAGEVSLNVRFGRDWMVETGWTETECPPPSHRTSLQAESGRGIFNAEIERRNRPIRRVSASRD